MSSHSHYKDIYKDMKHELKRKKRDIEDLEDQLRREEQDSKKLKSENHDLWKLYYGLQQELAAAYERNTKIQGDKVAFEALFERERQDWERQRLEFASSIDESVKLKSALCNMQKEKLAMQKKFNDLVVENKTLKEKEREIEPKLREIDELKRKLVEFETLLVALQSGFAKQRSDIKEATIRKEQIDGSKRWNDLLKRELDQKTKKIHHWDTLLKAYHFYELKCDELETQMKSKNDEIVDLRKRNETSSSRVDDMNRRLAECASSLIETKPELHSVRNEIDEQKRFLIENIEKVLKTLNERASSSTTTTTKIIDDASPANDDVVELSSANAHCSVDDINEQNYDDVGNINESNNDVDGHQQEINND